MSCTCRFRVLNFYVALAAILVGVLLALVSLLLPTEDPLLSLSWAGPLHFILPGILTLLLAIPALLTYKLAPDASQMLEKAYSTTSPDESTWSHPSVSAKEDIPVKTQEDKLEDFEEQIKITTDYPGGLQGYLPSELARALKLEQHGNHAFPS
jgi:hypothetical protein